MSQIEYKHRNLKDAIFGLCCLAHLGVNDKTLIDNLNFDCQCEIRLYDDLKKQYSKLYQALEIIFRKKVVILAFNNSNSVHDYNWEIYDTYNMTDDDYLLLYNEFDLLKDVFSKI